MKIVLLVFGLVFSAMANSRITFACQQQQGDVKILLNGGGFRYFSFEVQSASCIDQKGKLSFICGASDYKCGDGCLQIVDYQHQEGTKYCTTSQQGRIDWAILTMVYRKQEKSEAATYDWCACGKKDSEKPLIPSLSAEAERNLISEMFGIILRPL